MSEILESLFNSKEKTRLLRFFLQNPDQEYGPQEVMKRNMLNKAKGKKELDGLRKIKFVTERKKKGKNFYILNQNFIFYPELKNLVAKDNIYPKSRNLDKLKHLGNMKLAVVSGAFINYSKSKADMILVGDDVSRSRLKSLMSALEAELGKEIDFVLMNGEEFKYRLNMLDKFILEFLEGPHEEIVNKITGLKRFIAGRK